MKSPSSQLSRANRAETNLLPEVAEVVMLFPMSNEASAKSVNPLLLPEFAVPFERITAGDIVPAVDTLIQQSTDAMNAIIAAKPRTLENTLLAFDRLSAELEETVSLVSHLESVATSDALREAYAAVQPKLAAFSSSVSLSEGLYRALKEGNDMPWAKELSGAKRRFLEKTLDDFRRSGAELPEEGKKKLAAVDAELAQVTNITFSQNVLDSTNAFELLVENEEELAGLPEGAIAAARASAESKGQKGWRFTLQAPSLIAALTYLDDGKIREKIYRAFTTRASKPPHDNRPAVKRILELRRERANLLGFTNFADLALADRMAKNGKAARKFVEDLRDKTMPYFERENKELEAFVKAKEGNDRELNPWDVGYYAEKLRAEKYDFDEEALRPYFEANRVIQGIFEIASRLYGIRIAEWKDAPVWHESVKAYRVEDDKGDWIAAFYVDVFPRETKRDGAWMQGLFTGRTLGARHPRHLGVFCANVTPPVGNGPALLTHREVETLFHEFGHLMHHVFSRVELRAMSGTSVAWDFVELPSMIMENWCWEKEALDLFARHYETGATIPDDLLQKMLAARSFRAANAMMRQLGFAESDLALHVDFDPAKGGDAVEFTRSIMAKYSPVAPIPESATIASFGHLFSSPVGYAAGYYSYKWAEVLEADAFSRFKREGLLGGAAGAAFRENILSRGDSQDPQDLYKAFMGRSPDPEAMFIRAGLIASATSS